MKKWVFLICINIYLAALYAQGVPLVGEQKIPDDPAAETTARRWWYMDGNRVWLKFFNDGMLANYPDPLSSIWPKGSGINMSDGLAVLVQARVHVDKNGIPLPAGSEPDKSKGDATLYFCQTFYREDMDVDPSGQFNWGFYPVRGYLNLDQDKPAISNDSNSWPAGGWPDAPDFVDSLGVTEWNGYFGRGKTNADLEAYFVTNDAWDLEFQQENTRDLHFYPRPGKFLPGGKYQWGGLGARIGTRLFQWSHPFAQDVIFIHYDIANISDYDYDKIVLSFYIDSGIGGGMDDFSYMDKKLDMSWIYDYDGIGSGGIPVGIMAFAFLESPGIPYDQIDNDDDGIVDEERGPDRGYWTENGLEGPNGTLIDQFKFEEFYYPRTVGPHWTGDENQNWRSWVDLDSNDVYNNGDEINDDVGTDGVGPEDSNYYGPDADGTEANGKPDDGEPNFGRTDKDESDQIGLTSFQAWHRDAWTGNSPTMREFRHDSSYWELTSNGEFNPNFDELGNVLNLFASGPIPVKSWTKERFSVAELHTWDKPYQDPTNHSAPALFQLKKTVQAIYNTSYRFAKPPTKPALTAIPGDDQVTLIWDDVAEKSKEPFFDYAEDFEGYKIIRSTEPYFEDARVITDGYGSDLFLKPIAQYDLNDGLQGFADWGIYNGVSYYLGTDSGLKHRYVDKDVVNGRTYYYAVVAYDYGWEDIGLSPSENTATITLDQTDNISFIDRNCAMVTPRAPAAGYVNSKITDGWVFKEGTGLIEAIRINPDEIKEGHQYSVRFEEIRKDYDPETAINQYRLPDDKVFTYTTSNYYVLDVTDTTLIDTVLAEPFPSQAEFESPDFLGLYLQINNDVTPVKSEEYWVDEADESRMTINVEAKSLDKVPWDYSVHFVEDSVYTTPIQTLGVDSKLLPSRPINIFVLNHNYSHRIFNGTDSVMVPDTAALVLVDSDEDGNFEIRAGDASSDYLAIGELSSRLRKEWGGFFDIDNLAYAYTIKFIEGLPVPGSVLYIKTKRSFRETDQFNFSISRSELLNKELAKTQLKDIRVVPNPYVASNLMEPKVRQGLNQRRRLMFTHVPATCKISIYSVSGYLVDIIDVNNEADDGHAFWDMQTKEGLEISYGLYIYRVEAPGLGEHMGKFAVIK